VWQVSLPTKPNQIFFNGTRGTEVGSEASVTSVNEWCWASDVLYVHSSSNPAKAFTSPGIEASQLSYNIQLGSQDYLTIQNLHTTESNQFGIFQYGPASGTLTQTITGNTIDRAYYDGVVLGTAGSLYTSVEIGNNAVSECGGDGIHLNAGIQSATVEHNTVFSNNLLYTSSGTDTNLKFLAGIHFNGNGTNITNLVVQYNLVYSNGPSVYKTIDAGNGIWLDTIHDPNTVVRYNLLYGNTASGIMMENANRNQALYNISYSNGEAGIWVQNSDGTATSNQAVGLYNNTVFGNSVAGILLQGDYAVASTCTRNLVKNNISSGNTGPNLVARYGCENAAIYGSGNVYTYNDFGPQAANFIEWAGGVYESTYATWETATGNCGTTGCSHSVEADPQFVNASSSQFWLASGSPAIDAGLNLGSPYNIALMPGGTWPNSIVTGDQNAYGSGWEIGAFVYLPPVVISPP
jgi:parallel beta-helix repeat protein